MSLVVEETDETTAVAEPSAARWAPKQYFDTGFKAHVARELDLLRRLQAGWDGYRAAPIRAEIIDAARAFVFGLSENIAPRPRVVPLASGALQLEWVAGEVALELEFESPDIIHYLRWDPETNVADENTLAMAEREPVEALIKWFTRQDA
jgi:hypothetical protein